MIITLDGPAGVGKSTIAKIVAQELRLPFLNSGAMFRCLALRLGPESINIESGQLEKKYTDCNFELSGVGNNTELIFNDQVVGDEIRSEKVGALASRLATRPEVRNLLLQAQRRLGEKYDLVAEGRDMGTVVFPDAAFKFFLDADPHIRAKRRYLEEEELGHRINLEEIEKEIIQRDIQDRTRPIAPLRPAEDAMIIDTSFLNIEEATAKILHKIRASNK